MTVRTRIRIIAAAVLLALGTFAAPPLAAQTDPNLIRVGASTDDAIRPVLYAVQAGLFTKAGLNVQIIKLSNGAAVAAAVAGGSAEIGKGSALTAIVAYAKGLPFTVTTNLADFTSATPDTAMIVAAASPIMGVKDLAGKTIGVIGLEDFNTLSIDNWLQTNGIDPATVKFVEIPNSASLAALESGRIDATLVLEPVYSRAVAMQKFRVIGSPWTAIGKRFSEAVLFSTTTWVAAHGDAIAKFNRVVRDAATYVAAHEDETKPLAADFAGFDAATLQNFHPPARALTMSPGELQPVIDAAAQFKLIPKAFPARDLICGCAIAR
jgi:NitT/TauT family transport system substrate-binding protein